VIAWDRSRWPNFTLAEFACKHTGRCEMDPDFLDRMQALRDLLGEPLPVSSGYRDRSHPEEAGKAEPGAHAHGCAGDITCDGRLAFKILGLAPGLGFTGIGISQRKGRARFIHLDTWQAPPRPNVWSY
jgi:hypothetical protein